MNISFDYSSKSYKNIVIGKKYDLITNKHFDIQIVSYHKTLNQIDENVKLILIPYKINNESIVYDCNKFIEHIRVHYKNKLYNKPICLVLEKADEEEFFKDKKLQLLLTDTEYNNILDETVQIDIINSNEHSKILSQINYDIENNQNEHDIANKWGAYRLINLFKDQQNFSTIYENIYNSLAEQIFYKKLLFKDNQSNQTYKSDLNKIKSLKSKINQSNINIALIDDESQNGWYSIYSTLFSTIDDIYPEISDEKINDTQHTIDTFSEFYENIDKELVDKYDLFLLDLRLYEKDHLDYTQIDEISKLSGIKILQKIKEIDPTKSIIICTASNKSWSYKNILDLGADGFWNKESPLFNTSIEFSEHNLIDLLNTINTSFNENHFIKQVYHTIDYIYNYIKSENFALGEFIKRKRDLIFADLCSKGKFFDNFYNDQKYESAFIRTYTLMSEISKYLLEENDGEFRVSNNQNPIFCSTNFEGRNIVYTLSDHALNTINEHSHNDINRTYNHNLPEFHFLLYNVARLPLDNTSISRYYSILFRCRTKRNNSAFTHDTLDNQPQKYTKEDILELLTIYEEIIKAN